MIKDEYESFIKVEEMQDFILNNLFSDETNQYYSHTCMTDSERNAFIQGMVYASILSAVKCKKYRMECND